MTLKGNDGPKPIENENEPTYGNLDTKVLKEAVESIVGKPEKELIVFTNNGQTYIFHNISKLRPTTTGFTFTYTGKATGVVRDAVFNNTSVAGWAVAETK